MNDETLGVEQLELLKTGLAVPMHSLCIWPSSLKEKGRFLQMRLQVCVPQYIFTFIAPEHGQTLFPWSVFYYGYRIARFKIVSNCGLDSKEQPTLRKVHKFGNYPVHGN